MNPTESTEFSGRAIEEKRLQADSTIFLRTARLSFRSWQTDDLPLAQELWGDPEVMAFIDVRGGLNDQQLAQKLNGEIACQREHGTQYWPMFESATGDFVGCCGLKPWAHSRRDGPEIGFHIIKEKWGRGFAKEAARGVIRHAFENLKSKELMAGHHPDNQASQKILLELGFSFVEKVFFKPTGLMHFSYALNSSAIR